LLVTCALLLALALGPHVPAQLRAASPATTIDGPVYLPFIAKEIPPPIGDRIGFGAGTLGLDKYPESGTLRAGWYVNWMAEIAPQQPYGIEYVQMVRLHQKLTCANYTTSDRVRCPYVEPYAYTVSPSIAKIAAIAQANLGSVWLVGNEIDALDWNGGGQDEMLPELYAQAYHEIYTAIKAADSTARVAVAGIIQMTDLREQYLNQVWDSYMQLYDTEMPVDIWNVHNFVGPEECRREGELVCYNMAVPPNAAVAGILQGAYVGSDWRHTHMPTFEAQIWRFRQWMKDHGQQAKELIVTEYGALFANDIECRWAADSAACRAAYPSGIVPLSDGEHVRRFMLDSFDFFLNAKDCNLSAVDECRLVQRWAWFSLDSGGGSYNQHGSLFDQTTREITDTGKAYREWVDANFDALQLP
jgi:hypothetical protein